MRFDIVYIPTIYLRCTVHIDLCLNLFSSHRVKCYQFRLHLALVLDNELRKLPFFEGQAWAELVAHP